MMRFWKTTDAEYIERVRRYQQKKKRIAVLPLILGILASSGFVDAGYRMAHGILDAMAGPKTNGTVSFADMSATNQSSLILGLYIGSMFAVGATAALGVALHGLEMLTRPDRKAELLLKFVDENREVTSKAVEGAS